MMKLSFIFSYLGFTALCCMTCRNSAVGMTEDIGINSRFYPKHYIILKKWMRKLFHIKQHVIPRYLYLELLLSLLFFILGMFNTVIFIVDMAVGFDKTVEGYLIMFHVCLIIIDTIFFTIMSLIFKKE